MKIVDKYVYPTSSRASIAGLRHYTVDGEEQKLQSVTTVLGQTQPKDKQESLDRWRQRVGLREAQKITETANMFYIYNKCIKQEYQKLFLKMSPVFPALKNDTN